MELYREMVQKRKSYSVGEIMDIQCCLTEAVSIYLSKMVMAAAYFILTEAEWLRKYLTCQRMNRYGASIPAMVEFIICL